MRAFEQLDGLDETLQFARVTYELLRPAPLGDLQITASVVRPGRKVRLLEASLATPDGVEVVKALSISPGGPCTGERGVARISATRR